MCVWVSRRVDSESSLTAIRGYPRCSLPPPSVYNRCYPTVEDPFLVVVRDSIIYGISLDPDDKSNDAMVPVAGLQNGYDVDFDDAEQMIYWVEHPVSYTYN